MFAAAAAVEKAVIDPFQAANGLERFRGQNFN